MKNLITKTVKSIFNNGNDWIEVRELTVDGFKIDEHEDSKEQLLYRCKKGYSDRISKTLILEMKPSLVKMLDSIGYFSKDGFDSLSESEKNFATKREVSVYVDFKEKLKTAKGGYIRNETKIDHILDETIVELRNKFKYNKESLIKTEIETLNRFIGNTVKEQNDKYTREIVQPLTQRKHLNSILDINKDDKVISKIKETHEVECAKIDGEIEVYKNKIAELEKQKNEVYKNTANELFGDELEDLPAEVKEEVTKEDRFAIQRGIGFFS
jgi:hypothetical protein